MRKYLGPRNQGSLALTGIIGIAVIGIGSFYVMNSSRQTQNAVKVALDERARELGQSSNLSNLAILRSLLSESKLPNNNSYEPAIYASNYFAGNWSLTNNGNFVLNGVQANANKVTVKSFTPSATNVETVASIFQGSKSQVSTFNDTETLEIVALNADPLHADYISSVDVKARRNVPVDSKTNEKSVVTYGRIELPAPIPQGLTLKIKNVKDADFGTNFGSQANPLPPGKYQFQLSGKGVIHHGEMNVSGEKIILGLNKDGAITHSANNVRSDSVIGVTRVFDLTGGETASEEHVNKDGCVFDVENEVMPGALPGGLNVTAKLIAVDGKEAAQITANQTVIVGKVAAVAEQGAPVCQNSCPAEGYSKVYGSEEKFAGGLDRALNVGAPGNDTFESQKTVEINNKKGRGIICSNYELTAAQMKARTGMRPSDLMRVNPKLYRSELDKAINLKQYVAYMAPSCKREVVGTRNGCGCFAANTTIQMGDGSSKLASEIRAGDILWNPKTQKSQVVKRVIAGPERWPLLEVRSGGKTVVVTGEHPFLTKDGLKPAYRLTDKDILVDGEHEEPVQAIRTQERGPGETDPEVWNFELIGSSEADEHYVLANGVMTGDLYLQIKINGRAPERSEKGE